MVESRDLSRLRNVSAESAESAESAYCHFEKVSLLNGLVCSTFCIDQLRGRVVIAFGLESGILGLILSWVIAQALKMISVAALAIGWTLN